MMNESAVSIAVVSGKGGTGKTTVAVNLFSALQKESVKDICIVDCDVEAPDTALYFNEKRLQKTIPVVNRIPVVNVNKCQYCGACAEFCAFHAIVFIPSVPYIQVMPELCHSCGACILACNKVKAISEYESSLGEIREYSLVDDYRAYEGRLNVGKALAVPVIRMLLKQQNSGMNRIIDAPPGTSCPVVNTLSDVDYAIVVAEPTPFGLNDLKLMVETLRKMDKPFGVVINKCNIGNDCVKNYLLEQQISLLASIPFTVDYARLASSGKLLVDVDVALKNQLIHCYHMIVKNYSKA